jgi:hypothetical protein
LLQEQWFVGILHELELLRAFLFYLCQRVVLMGDDSSSSPLDIMLGGSLPPLHHRIKDSDAQVGNRAPRIVHLI